MQGDSRGGNVLALRSRAFPPTLCCGIVENSPKISVIRIVPDTVVDGPGMRTTVYCAGCRHHCEGCHNASTWNFDAGTPMTPREIWEEILRESPDSNITFSGGDPLFQVEGFTALAKLIKAESTKTIWCYTGFTFEQVFADAARSAILPWIDVLVDGRFVLAKRNTDLLFRGSENQRLIDVPATLRAGGVVQEWHSHFGII